MRRIISSCVLICTASTCIAGWPPGYDYIRITDTPVIERNPTLNSHGDVVFSMRFDNDESKEEIMLFSNDSLIQITDNNVRDALPSINADRTIVWSAHIGPVNLWGPTAEIARLRNGAVDYLTDDDVDDFDPRINSSGNIVWYKFNYEGCGSNRSIQYYDGSTIRSITDGSITDQDSELNDSGELVWGRYDFCTDPWTSEIIYWDGQGESQLTENQVQPATPDINNTGSISWFRYDRELQEKIVIVRKDGQQREIAYGAVPQINNHGDVFFWRFHDDIQQWQTWAVLRGELIRLTDDLEFNANGDINDRTDMVWMYRANREYDIVMLRRLPFGDMNCDKAVDFADIDGFVVALVSGKEEFIKQFPDCDWWLADMNDDRSIDFKDLDPFITCLIDGGCERP